jgi:hypothetical protein
MGFFGPRVLPEAYREFLRDAIEAGEPEFKDLPRPESPV